MSPIFRMVFIPNRLRLIALRLAGAQVAEGVLIRPHVRITAPHRLRIGAHSWVGENVTIDATSGVVVGANVVLSQCAVLCNTADDGLLEIADGAWIALRASVIGPVRVGTGAVVAACARADSDVDAGVVVPSPRVVTIASRPDSL